MFRKLISNLAFSPSLVGQLGFYSKRLSKEEATRRIGLIFTVLALIVQCVAVFQPPEAANASSSSDLVYGGLGTDSSRSLDNFLRPYDKNVGGLKDIMNYAGITRTEIATAQYGSWMTGDTISWSRTSHFSYNQRERAVAITNSDSQTVQTIYAYPMKLANGQTRTYGWVGHSSKLGWFAIVQASGNLVTKSIPPPPSQLPASTAVCRSLSITPLGHSSYRFNVAAGVQNGASVKGYTYIVKDTSGKVVASKVLTTTATSSNLTQPLATGAYSLQVVINTSLGNRTDASCSQQLTIAPPGTCPLNPSLTGESTDCQPCPNNQAIWVKAAACATQIVETKDAFNLDQNNNAVQSIADASQRIRYTITAKNEGDHASSVNLTDNIADSLEYAHLIDNGGGTFDTTSKTLAWGTITLQPGQGTVRTFVVQVDTTIPAAARGISDPTSYDCQMTNTFGTSTTVRVACPMSKIVEQTVQALPHTSATENLVFASIVLAIVTYFYARARQIKKEVRLIRRDLNAGVI